MKNPKSQGDPYENLANAIIIQAANDYVAALRKIRKNPNNKAALHDAMSIENFSIPDGSEPSLRLIRII